MAGTSGSCEREMWAIVEAQRGTDGSRQKGSMEEGKCGRGFYGWRIFYGYSLTGKNEAIEAGAAWGKEGADQGDSPLCPHSTAGGAGCTSHTPVFLLLICQPPSQHCEFLIPTYNIKQPVATIQQIHQHFPNQRVKKQNFKR